MTETFCYGTDIWLGNIYVKAIRIHRQTSKYYILSIYIVAICNAIIHIIHTDNGKTSARLCIHERHPIPRPHGRAMGCLPWDVQRKMTTIYLKHSLYLGDKSYFPYLRREHRYPNRRKQNSLQTCQGIFSQKCTLRFTESRVRDITVNENAYYGEGNALSNGIYNLTVL